MEFDAVYVPGGLYSECPLVSSYVSVVASKNGDCQRVLPPGLRKVDNTAHQQLLPNEGSQVAAMSPNPYEAQSNKTPSKTEVGNDFY